MIEQLQVPHTSICHAVKLSEQLQQAGLSLFVDFVCVVSEVGRMMYGGF
jgi:hypothetical protein